jgi:tetratricopeptide (TPR) repeat protein
MRFGQLKFSRKVQAAGLTTSIEDAASARKQHLSSHYFGRSAFLIIALLTMPSCTKTRGDLNIAQLETEFNDTKVPQEAKLSHLHSALAYTQATFGPDSKKTRSILMMLAQYYSAQRDFATAHEYWKKALALCNESDSSEIELKIRCVSGLIASECAQGKCEDSRDSYRELLRMRTSLYGAGAKQTLTTKKLLAETFQKKRRFSEAATLYEQAIKECPASNQWFMNSAKLSLARCYAETGKIREASAILDRLIASARRDNNGQQNPLLFEALKLDLQLNQKLDKRVPKA